MQTQSQSFATATDIDVANAISDAFEIYSKDVGEAEVSAARQMFGDAKLTPLTKAQAVQVMETAGVSGIEAAARLVRALNDRDLYCYAAHDAMQTLMKNWTDAIGDDAVVSLEALIPDIDVTIDMLREIRAKLVLVAPLQVARPAAAPGPN